MQIMYDMNNELWELEALLVASVCNQSKNTADGIKFVLDKIETIFLLENPS